MHAEDIKAALAKNGERASRLAKRLSVSRSAVSGVIHGNHSSRRIARAIAKVIGTPVSQIWPGRYDAVIGDRHRVTSRVRSLRRSVSGKA